MLQNYFNYRYVFIKLFLATGKYLLSLKYTEYHFFETMSSIMKILGFCLSYRTAK